MSYQEKKTITSIVTGVLVLAAYCIYAFGKYQAGHCCPRRSEILGSHHADLYRHWDCRLHCHSNRFSHSAFDFDCREGKNSEPGLDDKEIEKTIDAEMVEDEMDKLIELKSIEDRFYPCRDWICRGARVTGLQLFPGGDAQHPVHLLQRRFPV